MANFILFTECPYIKTFTLGNNLVKSISISAGDYVEKFTYNSSNQLIAIQHISTYGTHTDTSIDTYIWDNEKITKQTWTDSEEDDVVYECIYSGKTCKGYFPI